MSDYKNIPPHDLEAEKALLMAVLTCSEWQERVNFKIESDIFYNKKHKLIFKAVEMLLNQSENIDLITLKNQLVKNNTLTEVGGLVFLTGLMNEFSNSAHVQHYADIVKEKYILRSLISSCVNALELGYQGGSPDKIISVIGSAIQNVGEKSGRLKYKKIDQCVNNALVDMTTRDGTEKVRTGFHEIDMILKLTPGFHIVAARPSMGKTSFVMQVGSYNASNKIPVYMESIEMGEISVGKRSLSSHTGIKMTKYKENKLNDVDFEKLNKLLPSLINQEFYLNFPNQLNGDDLCTNIRVMKKLHDIGLVIVDYIGLMDIDDISDDKNTALGVISRKLKKLAMELGIPIIALSQLSREVEKRPDKRPIISDLRDSGNLEQDADSITFLYRPEYYRIFKDKDGNPTAGKAIAIIGKQRDGETGDVSLKFDAPTVSFKDDFKEKTFW